MNSELATLLLSTAIIGFTHTLVGPDHYLPFIVMAKARKWSILRTSLVTIFCGIGHVGSSVILGVTVIFMGLSITHLDFMEGLRGNLAGWLLVIFGLLYALIGLWRIWKNKPHTHIHVHDDGKIHAHKHTHQDAHDHSHKKNLTPWILFLIFVLGPCEPLIPLIFAGAEKNNMFGVTMVALVFSIVTLITMISIVTISYFGIKLLPLGKLEKYSHILAGFVIFMSGVGIQFWNW
jgi:sulfite exporter TauE/SafE